MAVPPGKAGIVRDRRWRGASLTSVLMFIGTLIWLIGSILFIVSQSRFRVVFIPGATPTSLPSLETGAIYSDSASWDAAKILWIIAAIFWVLGAMLHMITAFGQAALVTVQGKRPGVAFWTIVGAALQLVGTIFVLIGACVLAGSTAGTVSAGAILLLIGFTLWAHGIIAAFGVAFVVASMAPVMNDFRQRQYSWNGLVSILLILVQFILISLGCVLLIVRDPPGIWMTCALLWTVACVYGLFGWLLNIRGTWGFFTPILGFGTAAYATSGTLAGAGMGAGAGAAAAKSGAGMSAAPASAAMLPGTATGMTPSQAAMQQPSGVQVAV